MSTSPIDFSRNNVPSSMENLLSENGNVINLETWLQMVQYHSQGASYENQQSLLQLANYLPNSEICTPEVILVIEAIRKMAVEKMYDPTLSPKTLQALVSLTHQLPEKPHYARKLDFSDD